jgi:hypothetical protein
VDSNSHPLLKYIAQRGSIVAWCKAHGIARSVLYSWCAGDRHPTAAGFQRLSVATKMPVTLLRGMFEVTL